MSSKKISFLFLYVLLFSPLVSKAQVDEIRVSTTSGLYIKATTTVQTLATELYLCKQQESIRTVGYLHFKRWYDFYRDYFMKSEL